MKYYIIIAVAALLSACNQKNNEATNSNNDRDSLLSVINERDSSINDFIAVNSEIEHNLDDIAMKERTINMRMQKKSEINSSSKDRINADIAAINDLMNDNKREIDDLDHRLQKSNVKVAEYDQMIQALNARIADKDGEFITLNNQLASLRLTNKLLETSVVALSNEDAAQAQKNNRQNAAMHTAYYIVGKSKYLQDKKIIDKNGGLLGIGKTSEIDPNIDNSNFTKIDYSKVNNIDINGASAKIITAQPAGSYAFEKNEDKTVSLKIINPDKFWSASKYLVVESK